MDGGQGGCPLVRDAEEAECRPYNTIPIVLYGDWGFLLTPPNNGAGALVQDCHSISTFIRDPPETDAFERP